MDRYDADTKKFISNTIDAKEIDRLKALRTLAKTTQGLAQIRSKQDAIRFVTNKLIKETVNRGVDQIKEGSDASSLTMLGDTSHYKKNPLEWYKFLNSDFQSDWQDWEPETLWETIGVSNLTEIDKNIVMALQVVCKTDFPFEAYHVFENVVTAFCGQMPSFAHNQPLSPEEIAHGCSVLNKIRPKAEYSAEVLGYIASCAKNDGLTVLPKQMFPEGAQEFLDHIGNDLAVKDAVISGMNLSGELGDIVKSQRERLLEIAEYV